MAALSPYPRGVDGQARCWGQAEDVGAGADAGVVLAALAQVDNAATNDLADVLDHHCACMNPVSVRAGSRLGARMSIGLVQGLDLEIEHQVTTGMKVTARQRDGGDKGWCYSN